jgi:hypothetical protein
MRGGLCSGSACWPLGRRAPLRVSRRRADAPRLAKLVLTPGADGRATIGAQGHGVNLPPYALPLPIPLRLQLRGPAGQCWEAVYSAGGVARNDDKAFVGTGD